MASAGFALPAGQRRESEPLSASRRDVARECVHEGQGSRLRDHPALAPRSPHARLQGAVDARHGQRSRGRRRRADAGPSPRADRRGRPGSPRPSGTARSRPRRPSASVRTPCRLRNSPTAMCPAASLPSPESRAPSRRSRRFGVQVAAFLVDALDQLGHRSGSRGRRAPGARRAGARTRWRSRPMTRMPRRLEHLGEDRGREARPGLRGRPSPARARRRWRWLRTAGSGSCPSPGSAEAPSSIPGGAVVTGGLHPVVARRGTRSSTAGSVGCSPGESLSPTELSLKESADTSAP